MPSAERKKQKDPSRRAMRQRTRRQLRSETHSNITVNRFMRGDEPDLFVAKVVRALGGGDFQVQAPSVGTVTVSLKGSLRMGRRQGANPELRTAVVVGTYVLTNGDSIEAVLSHNEGKRLMANNNSNSNNDAPAGFRWNRGHTRRSKSRSRSSSMSSVSLGSL